MTRLSLLLPLNPQGKILLQHRTSDAKIKPDYWAFFGGHMEDGETPEIAARREFTEELQTEITVLIPFFKILVMWMDDIVEMNCFIIHLKEDLETLKPRLAEGQGLGYFSEEESNILKMTSMDRMVVSSVFKRVNEFPKPVN